jgi:hypothetical protein
MVPRSWPGETAVCIASGPSLTAEDVGYVRGKARSIVVNTTYRLAPWADVLYAADARWWIWHKGAMDFPGLKFSVGTPPSQYGVTRLKAAGEPGLSLDPGALCTGMNGGYQAINLAVLFGVVRIVLLGYDLQLGPAKEEHWHGPHNPRSIVAPSLLEQKLARFRAAFTALVAPLNAAGIAIVNCTRRTALTCFPCRALEATL